MILRTTEQVRRVFPDSSRIHVIGPGNHYDLYTGSGHAGDLDGLGFARAEFVWARRIMERVRRESTHLKDSLWRPEE